MKEHKAPHYLKNLINSDPDFVAIVENLIANETQNPLKLDEKDYQVAILSACIGVGGLDLFKKILADCVKDCVLSILEIRELVYQSQAYTGLTNSYSFVKELSKFIGKNEIKLPKEPKEDLAVDNQERRLAKDQKIQEILFGKLSVVEENALKYELDKLIKANCYGDFFSRKNLSLRLRELSAFSILVAMGQCGKQLQAHIIANYVAGNEYAELIKVVSAIIPFVGYVKASNALDVLINVNKQETKKEPKSKDSKVESPTSKEKADKHIVSKNVVKQEQKESKDVKATASSNNNQVAKVLKKKTKR